jgi:hypothetical protein
MFLGEWPRLPSTARVERAHSDRARSASKEGAWPLPPYHFQSADAKASENFSGLPQLPAFVVEGATSAE